LLVGVKRCSGGQACSFMLLCARSSTG